MSLDLNFDNPGLRKENKIKKVSWENWENDTNPYNDKFEPDEIAQVPGNTSSYKVPSLARRTEELVVWWLVVGVM